MPLDGSLKFDGEATKNKLDFTKLRLAELDKAITALDHTHSLIRTPARWCIGDLKKTGRLYGIIPINQYCLLGALTEVNANGVAVAAIAETIGVSSKNIPSWNDRSPYENVIDVLLLAKQKLRAEFDAISQ